MEIPINAKVQCADGSGGEATHVIIHPAAKRVTRLVVKEGRAPHVERLVPFRFIQDVTDDQIQLRCSQQELSRMQMLLRTRFVENTPAYYGRRPAEAQTIYTSPKFKKVKHENIPEDELTVDRNTRVRATDGNVGRIGKLMVEPASGSITHLMLREGHIWAPKEVTVPMSQVDRIADRAVYLKVNRTGIEALPATAARRR